MPANTTHFPAPYRAGHLSFLLHSPRPDPAVLYWMNSAALYAEMNKMDCFAQDVIWPHSSGADYMIDLLPRPGVTHTDPETGALLVKAPLVDVREFAHPSKERRLHWSDGRHRTAAFVTLGAPVVPLACTPADVPTLERIEADFAAGLLPASPQPYNKSLCAAKERWWPFEVVVGVSSEAAGKVDSEAARLDRRARQEQFKLKLAETYPGARVRFAFDQDDRVSVTRPTDEPWFSKLLRVRDRRAGRLLDAACLLSLELGL